MGKSYTVVFNSIIAPNSVVGEVFNYDWGQLPNKPYKVTFSFIGTIDTITNNTIAVVYLDLGQQAAMVASINSTTGAKNKVLGCLLPSGTGANNFLYADTHTNPAIYLNGRPTNNTIFIEIHTNAAGSMTNYSPSAWEYMLTINLEEQ